MKIEYKVRPITRYIVTRFHRDGPSAGCGSMGEYDNYETAHAVGYALAKKESDDLGLPPGDMSVIFPGCFDPELAAAKSTAE